MDVTPLIREGTQIIQSYSEDGFKINGIRYKDGVIVTPAQTIEWRNKTDVNALTLNDFAQVLSLSDDYDICLLGTGKVMVFPPPTLLKALRAENLKPDIMDTGAACRTYNVLVAEGRRVMATLLPL